MTKRRIIAGLLGVCLVMSVVIPCMADVSIASGKIAADLTKSTCKVVKGKCTGSCTYVTRRTGKTHKMNCSNTPNCRCGAFGVYADKTNDTATNIMNISTSGLK